MHHSDAEIRFERALLKTILDSDQEARRICSINRAVIVGKREKYRGANRDSVSAINLHNSWFLCDNAGA